MLGLFENVKVTW